MVRMTELPDTTTEPTAKGTPPLVTSILLSAGLGLLWILLAASNPDTTYHLAPLLVAGSGPIPMRRPGPRRLGFNVSAIGTAISLAITVLLAAMDKLNGPSLLPFGGAVEEALIFAVVGGLFGLAYSATLGD